MGEPLLYTGAELAQDIRRHIIGNPLVGFRDDGMMCVFTGDAEFKQVSLLGDSMSEAGVFTNGRLMGPRAELDDDPLEIAREEMESRGYEVLEN